MPFEKMLSIKQVAEVLELSPMTIWRMVSTGYIPARKVGRQWRISAQTIERFTEKRTNQVHHHTVP